MNPGPPASGYLLRQIKMTWGNRAMLAFVAALFFGTSPMVSKSMEGPDYNPETEPIAYGIAFLLAVWAAFQVPSYLDPSKSTVWKELERYGDPAETLNTIEEQVELHGQLVVGGIRFTRDWFVRGSGVSLIICKIDDLTEIRCQEHKKKKVGVTLTSIYMLRMRATDDREWEFQIPSKGVQDLMGYLAARRHDIPVVDKGHRGTIAAFLEGIRGED